jgi:hypothetical protein
LWEVGKGSSVQSGGLAARCGVSPGRHDLPLEAEEAADSSALGFACRRSLGCGVGLVASILASGSQV